MSTSPLLAWVDGSAVPLAEARVPLIDEGLLRGDGCFEVVRFFSGRPFCLDEHLERMARSAAALRLPVDGVAHAVAALGRDFDGYVRVLVTRGPPPSVYALQEHPHPVPDCMRLKTVAAPWLVPLGSSALAGAKTLSYAHHMAARREAEEQGYDDAVLVTPAGTVLEGTTWSLMWVEGGNILAPPLHLGILDSITRRKVMEMVEVEEREAPVERLLGADEVLVVSTTRLGVGVGCVDEREWPDAPGPVTCDLADRFRRLVSA